jgi:hypothetical protein
MRRRAESASAAAHHDPVKSARLPAPLKLGWMNFEEAVTVWHPDRGEVTACAFGRILYEELTQRQRGAENPWVPTGSTFLGFRLEANLILLNWQNRFYLLDSRAEVTDDDIRRSFASHARAFGAADQNAKVVFEYPASKKWRIDDIGRFRVGDINGEWFPAEVGATGRFLHASGEGSRVLVVEDFDGGGQDSVWTGYRIKEQDVQKL